MLFFRFRYACRCSLSRCNFFLCFSLVEAIWYCVAPVGMVGIGLGVSYPTKSSDAAETCSVSFIVTPKHLCLPPPSSQGDTAPFS